MHVLLKTERYAVILFKNEHQLSDNNLTPLFITYEIHQSNSFKEYSLKKKKNLIKKHLKTPP